MKTSRGSSDRRMAVRVQCTSNIEVSCFSKDSSVPSQVLKADLVDISLGGLRMQTNGFLREGQRVFARLNDNFVGEEPLRGVVAWSETPDSTPRPLRYGIKFLETSEDQTQKLKQFLEETLQSRRTRKIKVDRRKLDFFNRWMANLDEEGTDFQFHVAHGPPLDKVVYDGKEVIQLCSNNSLGMSVHPKVIAAAKAALEIYGTGCGGSRLISGNLQLLKDLELVISGFLGVEDTVLFMTGYMGNVGGIEAMTNISFLNRKVNVGNVVGIFSDHENHKSIIHGCRLAEIKNHAVMRTYRHLDMDQLEDQLRTTHTNRKIIITEGVFSMRGDLAPLKDISALANKYNALIYLDDSHGIGHMGRTGRGSVEHWGVKNVDVILGTFSKAFGAAGGFICAQSNLCDYLRLQANTYIFSSALPPATVAGVKEAFSVFDSDLNLHKQFWKNVDYFKKKVLDLGFDILGSQSHIIPILIGSEHKAKRIAADLFKSGVFLPAVRYPATAPGKAILRCMLTVKHTTQQIDFVVDELGKLGRQEGIIPGA